MPADRTETQRACVHGSRVATYLKEDCRLAAIGNGDMKKEMHGEICVLKKRAY